MYFLCLLSLFLQIHAITYSRHYYTMFINQTRLLIKQSSMSNDQSLILIVEASGTISIGVFKNPKDLTQGFDYNQSLVAPPYSINVAKFSEDNKFIVSGGKDLYIRIWKFNNTTGTYDPYQNISNAHTLSINNIFFFPNSNYIISAALEEKVTKIWKFNSTTGLYELYQIINHQYTIISSNFFPSLMKIAAACVNSTVEIWLWNNTDSLFYLNHTHYDSNFSYLVVGSQIFTEAILTHNGTQLIVIAYYLKGIMIYIWNQTTNQYQYGYKYNLTQYILSYGLSKNEDMIAFNSQQTTFIYLLKYQNNIYSYFMIVNNQNTNDSSMYFPNKIFFSNNYNILICSDVLLLKIYAYGCQISDYFNQSDQLCYSGCNILNINTTKLYLQNGSCNCATNYIYVQEYQACIWDCSKVPNSIVDTTYTYQFQAQLGDSKIKCLCVNQYTFILEQNACALSCDNILNSPRTNKDINSCNCNLLYKWNSAILQCELDTTLVIIISISILLGIIIFICIAILMKHIKKLLIKRERQKKQLRIIPQQTIRKELELKTSTNESDFSLKIQNNNSKTLRQATIQQINMK